MPPCSETRRTYLERKALALETPKVGISLMLEENGAPKSFLRAKYIITYIGVLKRGFLDIYAGNDQAGRTEFKTQIRAMDHEADQ